MVLLGNAQRQENLCRLFSLGIKGLAEVVLGIANNGDDVPVGTWCLSHVGSFRDEWGELNHSGRWGPLMEGMKQGFANPMDGLKKSAGCGWLAHQNPVMYQVSLCWNWPIATMMARRACQAK